MSSYDHKEIPQIDPEINAEELTYLENVLKPFPQLSEKNRFFATSKQAQKVRYVCALVLSDLMSLRRDDIDVGDRADEKGIIESRIKENLGKLDQLGISSSPITGRSNLQKPLELAKSLAGQLLSIRQELSLDESANFVVANAASYGLGLPFTEEYTKLINTWPGRPPVIPLR